MKRTTKRRSGTTRKRPTTTRKATPRTPEHPAPGKGERVFILDVPFEERAVARHFGARYFSSEGWAYVGTSLPSDLERYRPKKYSWQEWQERTLMGELSATTPAPAPDPETGTFTLRRDQLQDVKKVLLARQAGAPEVLNASGVGVGKTAVAIAAIKRMSQIKNVLVICPLAVAEGWRLHLRDMGDGDMNWCIINYESTKRLLEPPASAKTAKRTRTKNLHTVQKGTPKVQWDVIVVDESHYCFPGDTLISTEGGPVEIAELVSLHGSGAPLPKVLSQAADGSLGFQEVTGVFISPTAPLVRVRHALGEVVCTEDHPLHSKEHGYAPASLLQEGDTLTVNLSEEGEKGVGESKVTRVDPIRQGPEPTFNLSVDTNENYFANGVLAHNCSNPESQRTRAIDKIVAGPAHRPAFKINMSATAGKDPSKVSYLHRALFWTDGLQPLPHIDAERYTQWCESHRLSVGNDSFGNALKWDPEKNGSNPDRELERLHALLFQGEPPWAFRRMPDWPEQRRIPAPVELTWEEMEAYNADWKEFQKALAAIDRKMKSTASGKTKSALRAKGLAEQVRYRQKAGQVRAPGTAAFAAEMVSKGHQVAISAEYLGTVNRLHEELERLKVPTALFTGENANTREDERIAYQRGEKKVIIYTPTEGFNLHAGETAVGGNTVPRVTIVAEPRWSPGKALQAEGRCLVEGQTILTSRGSIPIEDVLIGDQVLTHRGRWRPVSKTWSRNVERSPRERLTTISYQGTTEPLVATSDHKVWLRRRGEGQASWVEASNVLPGDHLLSPAFAPSSGLPELPFPEECRTYERDAFTSICTECGRDDTPLVGRGRCGRCYPKYVRAIRLPDGSLPPFTRQPNGRYIPAPENIPVTDEFLDFIGWYLAEGFAGIKSTGVGKAISLAGHRNERPILEKHGDYLRRMFGVHWKVFDSKVSNSSELRAWGSDLAKWLHRDFGHMAQNKHLPYWFWDLSKEQQRRLLDSYFSGDGHRRKMVNGRPWQEWTTASSRLHNELMAAVAGLGFKPSGWQSARRKNASAIEGREIRSLGHCQGGFALSPSEANEVLSQEGAWRRVKEVTTAFASKGTRVWDLSVEEDHSFVAGLVAVHNSHRNATDAPVYYTFASGTVEENVIHRCIDGMRNIGKINGDDTKPFEGLKEALGVPVVF